MPAQTTTKRSSTVHIGTTVDYVEIEVTEEGGHVTCMIVVSQDGHPDAQRAAQAIDDFPAFVDIITRLGRDMLPSGPPPMPRMPAMPAR